MKGAFRLYDLDNDGTITKDEMTQIVAAIFNMVGNDNRDQMPNDDNTPEKRVDRIFDLMDKVSEFFCRFHYPTFERTVMGAYRKRSSCWVPNKTNQLCKHCRCTMASSSLSFFLVYYAYKNLDLLFIDRDYYVKNTFVLSENLHEPQLTSFWLLKINRSRLV